ncbi:MAG: RNA polymerase sigma factor, partial [Patescibacteria group bacterium]
MNRQHYSTFYHANLKRIYRYVFFRTGRNRDVAEDLVSDIFMKAFEHFESYDPEISESAWIYRIAHNRVLNYWRDTKATANIDDDAISAVLGGDDYRGKYADKLDIERLLAKLSPEERQLVTLKYLAGYQYSTMG